MPAACTSANSSAPASTPRSSLFPDAASPQSLIIVDEGGERTVLCRRDERLLLQPSDLKRDWIVNARALHVDGFETAAATQATTWAREAGIPVIADLDETYAGVEDLIANVDYLIVSRDFPSRLTGERNLEQALRKIKNRYGCKLAAATLGADGVIAWDGEDFHLNPAYHVPVTDTTGAGDIFHAGFIYGLLQDWPLVQQLDFACAAAALNCTCSGARGGIKDVEAIEELDGQHTSLRHRERGGLIRFRSLSSGTCPRNSRSRLRSCEWRVSFSSRHKWMKCRVSTERCSD